MIANGELKYYVDKIGAEIKKKNFEVALDVIVYELNRFISDGKFVGFVDVHNELLQRVIDIYKLLNKEKWNQSHFNPKNSQDLKYKVHSSVKEILDKSNS